MQNEELQTEMKEIYKQQPSFENYLRDLPKGQQIARWLESNPNNYFASADYERESYQEEETSAYPFGGFTQLMKGNKIVTKYRNILMGFALSIDLPYKYVVVDFNPLFPNLQQYALMVAFLVSKKDIKIFTAFTSYSETDWTRKVINQNFKWNSSDFLIKDIEDIKKFIISKIREAEEEIMDIVKNEFDNKK
jgi:hypothetical protein